MPTRCRHPDPLLPGGPSAPSTPKIGCNHQPSSLGRSDQLDLQVAIVTLSRRFAVEVHRQFDTHPAPAARFIFWTMSTDNDTDTRSLRLQFPIHVIHLEHLIYLHNGHENLRIRMVTCEVIHSILSDRCRECNGKDSENTGAAIVWDVTERAEVTARPVPVRHGVPESTLPPPSCLIFRYTSRFSMPTQGGAVGCVYIVTDGAILDSLSLA